jgi:hypothetical protein
MHSWSRRSRKCVTLFLLAVVLIPLTATTVNAASSASQAASAPNTTSLVGATTHPIQYAIAGPPSMVDDGSSLAYFKAHGFSIVELVVPDSGTYQTELNTIKALGMQPVIDVEMVIWNGGKLQSTPITSFHAYFQSLKSAGWEYVASEGGRSGDSSYIKSLGLGYINYNCDQCGLWSDIYIENGTVLNSWESYYSSEWPYIQNGSTQAAALGIQNGIMAGLWENVNSDNQIYANSLPGSTTTPSYLSMLNWSYANGVGFNQFCVWCGNDTTALQDYENLEFPQIVANLQIDYPACSLSATISTTTAYVNQNFAINGTLSVGFTGVDSQTITLQRSTNIATWNNVTTNVTDATGGYQFSQNESVAGTYYYRTAYAVNATDTNATSNLVNVNVVGVAGAPAVSSQSANTLDLFFRGSDGALWWKHWNGATWSASASLGGVLTSDPAATSPGNGVVDVFVRGGDGALYEKTTTNGGTSWSYWSSLGGQIPAGTVPSVCSSGAGRLDLFVQGMDGALWHKSYTGTSWSGWQSLGGVLTSSPAAATAAGSSRIDVFVRGGDGAVWQRTTTNAGSSWSGWTSRGGQIPVNTVPAACSWGSGRLDLFVQGTDGQLWWRYTTNGGGSWSGWQSLGGQLTSSPAAAAPASGIMDVFVRGGDNGFWERTYNSSSWSGWTSIAI